MSLPTTRSATAGDQLHDWIFAGRSAADARAREEEQFATTGAVLMGRPMLDLGLGPWGDDPTFHAPVIVVTHRAAEPIVKHGGTTYTFVTDGPDATLQRARDAAGDQHICVAGGAPVVQHYLRAGAIDELRLHLVPILLHGGVRLFGEDAPHAELTLQPGVSAEAGVVHLRYHVGG